MEVEIWRDLGGREEGKGKKRGIIRYGRGGKDIQRVRKLNICVLQWGMGNSE